MILRNSFLLRRRGSQWISGSKSESVPGSFQYFYCLIEVWRFAGQLWLLSSPASGQSRSAFGKEINWGWPEVRDLEIWPKTGIASAPISQLNCLVAWQIAPRYMYVMYVCLNNVVPTWISCELLPSKASSILPGAFQHFQGISIPTRQLEGLPPTGKYSVHPHIMYFCPFRSAEIH